MMCTLVVTKYSTLSINSVRATKYSLQKRQVAENVFVPENVFAPYLLYLF